MSNPRSLAFQASCIRDVLPSAQNHDVRAGLEASIRTLEWIENNADAIREVARLMKETPFVIDVLRTFPGAKIEVRDAV